jgi:hypothetical protein
VPASARKYRALEGAVAPEKGHIRGNRSQEYDSKRREEIRKEKLLVIFQEEVSFILPVRFDVPPLVIHC